MEILKTATDWGKAEVFSTLFFILFAIVFLLPAIGFWQLGKTDVAKAFIYPTLVAGSLLLLMGCGLFFSSKARLANFETEYKQAPAAFIQSEIDRTEKTIKSYQNVALKVFPAIIAVAALLLIFIDKPIWRAISITVIAWMLVVIWVDSNAKARIEAYHQQLVVEQADLQN